MTGIIYKDNAGNNVFIDYPDADEHLVYPSGKKVRFTFHEWGGPSFYRKNGEWWNPGSRALIWKLFNKWFANYKKRQQCPA